MPLAVLHRAVTPEAVREEVERLTMADRMAGCLGVWLVQNCREEEWQFTARLDC